MFPHALGNCNAPGSDAMPANVSRSMHTGSSERFERMRARNKAQREMRSKQREKRKAIRELAEAKEQRRAERVQRAQNASNLVSNMQFATVEQSAGLFALTMEKVQARTLGRIDELV